MTERPEGTPEAVPSEPEEAPDSDAADVESADAELELEPEPEPGDDTSDDPGQDEFEDETVVPLGEEPAAPLAAATMAAGSRRRGSPVPVAQRAPTQSELAVRVTDNTSRFFVIGTVVVFAGILAFGVFAGNGGLLTTTPVPTAAPSVSVAPSASAPPSTSAAPSKTVEASASPS